MRRSCSRSLPYCMLPVRHQLLRAAVAKGGHKAPVGAPQVGEFAGAGVNAARQACQVGRARKPRLERLAKARETNDYWLGELGGAQTDPRRLAATRSVQAGYERITPQDVQAAAKQYLTPDSAWRLVVLPEAKQPAQAATQ